MCQAFLRQSTVKASPKRACRSTITCFGHTQSCRKFLFPCPRRKYYIFRAPQSRPPSPTCPHPTFPWTKRRKPITVSCQHRSSRPLLGRTSSIPRIQKNPIHPREDPQQSFVLNPLRSLHARSAIGPIASSQADFLLLRLQSAGQQPIEG